MGRRSSCSRSRAASDILDGYLAKTFGWSSELGKVLDPLADKLLLVSVFITLAVDRPRASSGSPRSRCCATSSSASARPSTNGVFGPLEGRPTIPSKINTLVQLLFVIAVVWNAAFHDLPGWAIRASARACW